MSFDARELANPVVAALRAYDPGHDLPSLRRRFGAQLAELGSNENPLGPSPKVATAIQSALADVLRYPDPKGASLKAAIARVHEADVSRVALGNGSHELLMLLAQCFADATTSIVFSQFGFAVFPIAAASVGAQAICVPALSRDDAHAPLGHDLDAMADAVRADTRIVYLANPNNPTGTWFSDEALERLLKRVPATTLVVVDEAYHEFVETPELTSALRFASGYPNLVVSRTFSKAYALAGLRVGYVVADSSVVAVIERLRESFNVNSLALVAAEAALSDVEHLAKVREWTRAEREWLALNLRERGYTVMPSQTNFVLVDPGCDASELEAQLFERGVIVRPMAGYGLGHTVRISIGSRVENERLLAALP
jgi:histidinol-phosphate aminotransferase